MSFDPSKPYNDLPNLPPSVELETKSVLKSCVSTRAALAALRQATALIPNPMVLINTIPLLEAQASSEIENIVTTADALFRHGNWSRLRPMLQPKRRSSTGPLSRLDLIRSKNVR